MDFQDFPKILGNLGVETDHPPEMCAGLRTNTTSQTLYAARPRPRKRTKYLGIGALPVRKVESTEAVRTCALCLEDMEVGSEVRTLPCFHFFHASCSEEWLRRENSCPLCPLRRAGVRIYSL